jgi:3-oxoacyl-[acyl-carrier-protein] synthase-3
MPAKCAKIKSVGMYLPSKIVTNEELAAMVEYDVEEYLKEKGIRLRHQAAAGEATSDMAVSASREALEKSGMTAGELDLIILCTDTPDYVTPPTSAIIQHKLGATQAGCFDVNAACADETIGMVLASHYIMLDEAIKNVLVIGAYGMTKWIDWSKYSESSSKVLAMLFGDGAASVIISESDQPGYLSSCTCAVGSYWDTYGIYLGTARPPDSIMIEQKNHCLRFHENQNRVPPDFNTSRWPPLIKKTVNKAGCEVKDLALILMTQVELGAIKETMTNLGLPLSKTHWVMDKFGYTGSASALMALYDALEQGKIESGDLVAFSTTGAGFILAAALFRWI